MKEIIHETLYDFANGCRICKEPVVSVWQGFGVGYSFGTINHKNNCQKIKQDRKTSDNIFKQNSKLGLLNF